MELFIRTLRGNCRVSGVVTDSTVGDLKSLLHQSQADALHVPVPEQQRLIYQEKLLPDQNTLRDAGVAHGDVLVLLYDRPAVQQPTVSAPQPSPTRAEIRDAIMAEARRRGIEDTVRDEPSPRQRRSAAINTLLRAGIQDVRLVQILEALEGRLNMSLPGSEEDGAEGEGGSEGSSSGGGASAEAAAEIRAPEPAAANVSQLVDMGFTEPVVRKALILTKDNVNAALEWILQHGEEANAAEPPTQDQLRAVYGQPLRQQQRRTRAQALSQLVDMGFDTESASQALNRYRSFDLALAYLLQQQERGGRAPPAASAAPAGEPSTSAAAAPSRAASAAAAAAPPAAAAEQAAAAAQRAADVAAAASAAAAILDTVMREAEADSDDQYEDARGSEDAETADGYDSEDELGDPESPTYALRLRMTGPLAGSMSSMDLAELGSADMEHMLEGVVNDVSYPYPALGRMESSGGNSNSATAAAGTAVSGSATAAAASTSLNATSMLAAVHRAALHASRLRPNSSDSRDGGASGSGSRAAGQEQQRQQQEREH